MESIICKLLNVILEQNHTDTQNLKMENNIGKSYKPQTATL